MHGVRIFISVRNITEAGVAKAGVHAVAHLQEVVLASKEQKGAVRLVPFLIKIG